MTKRKIFSTETRKEIIWWAASGAVVTLEYVIYTRYRELSPSEILVAYQSALYSPPSILESGLLGMLFLLMAATGIVFLIFSHKLGTKLYKWLVHASKKSS